jgi:hypothetical protein
MLDARGGVGPGEKTRAQRFELQIPLQYRAGGEVDWHRGTTRNISRSGVLFQGEDWAEPRSHLELNLRLPWEKTVDRAAELACRGTVTRSERGGSEEGGHLIAISISHYRLVRSQDGRRASDTAQSS